MKHNKGIMYATWIFHWSEIKPIMTGKKAPPAIAITTNDDPSSVSSFMSSMASENMVGNMIDSKNGTEKTIQTASSD
jgi:hypothetical protein